MKGVVSGVVDSAGELAGGAVAVASAVGGMVVADALGGMKEVGGEAAVERVLAAGEMASETLETSREAVGGIAGTAVDVLEKSGREGAGLIVSGLKDNVQLLDAVGRTTVSTVRGAVGALAAVDGSADGGDAAAAAGGGEGGDGAEAAAAAAVAAAAAAACSTIGSTSSAGRRTLRRSRASRTAA